METYSPFKLDDFWNDCVNSENIISSNYNNKKINNNINKLNSNKVNNNKITRNPFQNNNILKINNKTKVHISAIDKLYKKLNIKNPQLFNNNSNNKIIDKKRIKNSLLRSITLYEEGLAKKKLIEKNMEENQKIQIYKELSLCTFRPKISRKKNDNEVINPYYKKIYERDLPKNAKLKQCYKSLEFINKNKLINNSSENENKVRREEKLNKHKKLFNNKSQIYLKQKENAEFILRYTKARDEKVIKKVKKLYKKDDSYNYYLNTLTSRVGNNEYKNSLNVNHIIPLYGESVSRNNYINSYIGEFKGLSFNENVHIKQSKKDKKHIMYEIRKGLMDIKLNDNNGI